MTLFPALRRVDPKAIEILTRGDTPDAMMRCFGRQRALEFVPKPHPLDTIIAKLADVPGDY